LGRPVPWGWQPSFLRHKAGRLQPVRIGTASRKRGLLDSEMGCPDPKKRCGRRG